MRKFLSIVMALVLGFTFASAETTRLYCKVAQDWWKADGAAVGAYFFGGDAGVKVGWPGERMTAVEGEADTWYVDVDAAVYPKVIFTRVNGSGNVSDYGAKTGDLEIPADGKNLYTITSTSAVWGDPGVAGEWSVKASGEQGGEQGGGEQEVETRTVYFVNTLDWAAVKAHVWGGENIASTTWPGDAMTKEANKINDKDVYSYTFNTAHNNIVFNNGGEPIIQTVDLELNASSVYFVPGELSGTKYTGAWYATAEAISEGGDVPVVEKKGIFLAGEMNGWSETANPMVVNADSSIASVTVALQARSYEFKIISDGTYLSLNGEGETKYQFNRNWTATPNAVNLTGGRNFELVADVAGNYTFNWSTADSLLSITFPAAGEEQPTLHYLVGSAASMGAWAPENAVLMQGDSIVLDLAAGEYQFKVLFQQAWGDQLGYSDLNAECSSEGLSQGENDNIVGTLAEAGQLKVKVVGGKLCVTGNFVAGGDDPQPEVTYLLIGSDPAIGAWEGAGAVALVDGKVTVTLQAGNCEFKVVSSNWNWDDSFDYSKVNAECSSAGISEGDNGNIKVTLAAAGDMTVEIKDGKLCVTGNFVAGDEPGGDPQPSTTYLLFGSDPAIGAWEGAGAVAMVDGKATVTLQAGDCEFKVVSSNWNWDDSFDYSKVNAECSSAGISEGDNGNIKVTLAAAGDMTVEIKDGKLCVTGNFVAGDEPGGNPQVDGYFLIGSDPAIGGQDWVGANAVSMTDGKATVTLQAGECQFKVVPVINGAWNWEKALGYADVDAECSSAGIESGDNGNVKVVLDVAGEVKVEVKNGKLCVTGEFTIPTTLNLANGFYLIGKTGWTVDALSADLLFKANADKAGEYTLEIALVENDPLKVVKVEGDAITAWYPEGEGNEYKVDAAHAGLKTIYFQETMNPDWAAFGGYIYIEGTTGIESVENAASAQKFIEDGQLFILINGTVYSVMGMVR